MYCRLLNLNGGTRGIILSLSLPPSLLAGRVASVLGAGGELERMAPYCPPQPPARGLWQVGSVQHLPLSQVRCPLSVTAVLI